ncbi:hypothetical protein [Lactococcus garvieae]|uniref:hypothetical protein n=1 Tax=Lactococcus garvieae TaxID=1363 RepID=UPI00398F0C5B
MIEIASLIVDILSLCVTILLTFLIYHLQKKDEKKHDRERNEELARNFIIDNQSEINLLPWCMVASNVKDLPALQEWKNKKKYSHQIYLEFDKQPEGVKNEILRQENITLRLPGTNDWVSEYLEYLSADAFESGLCSTKDCYLYNDAKYFHRGISNYGGTKLEGMVRIEMPNIPVKESKTILGTYRPTFDDYLAEAIYKANGEYSKLMDDAIPPLDFANQTFSKEGEMFSLCIMQFVRSFSISISIKNGRDEEVVAKNGREVSTYEDYYYDALLELYLAYHPRH